MGKVIAEKLIHFRIMKKKLISVVPQVLIEKLLYSCSELKEILILMRPKRGKVPEARLEEMFKLPVSIISFAVFS